MTRESRPTKLTGSPRGLSLTLAEPERDPLFLCCVNTVRFLNAGLHRSEVGQPKCQLIPNAGCCPTVNVSRSNVLLSLPHANSPLPLLTAVQHRCTGGRPSGEPQTAFTGGTVPTRWPRRSIDPSASPSTRTPTASGSHSGWTKQLRAKSCSSPTSCPRKPPKDPTGSGWRQTEKRRSAGSKWRNMVAPTGFNAALFPPRRER